jgi:hypothetical protein
MLWQLTGARGFWTVVWQWVEIAWQNSSIVRVITN